MDVSYRYSSAVLDGRKAILQEDGTVEFAADAPEDTKPEAEVAKPEVTKPAKKSK